MAHFLVEYRDLGASQLREEKRPEHIAYRKSLGGALLLAGPLLSDEDKAVGSVVILEAADRNAAEDIARQDPYVRLGVMQLVSARRYRIAALQPPRATP